METIEIILLIVSINLVIKLMTNFTTSGFRKKQNEDMKLVLAYLENNEVDRLQFLKETIPSLESDLMTIRHETIPSIESDLSGIESDLAEIRTKLKNIS